MSRSRVNVGDVIDEIASIKREMNDEKTRQIIGGDQIKMKLSASNSQWDMSVAPNRPGQVANGEGWTVVIVTARSKNSENLVGRLAIQSSALNAVYSVIGIPLLPSHNDIMKWFVPVFGTMNQPISLKFQIIANDACDISFEEWTPWQ